MKVEVLAWQQHENIERVALEFCRQLGVDPFGYSNKAGYEGEFNMNWARDQAEVAIAMRAAFGAAV